MSIKIKINLKSKYLCTNLDHNRLKFSLIVVGKSITPVFLSGDQKSY
jgi:hypothetical protein